MTLPSWLATPLSAFLFNFSTSFSLISLSLSFRLPEAGGQKRFTYTAESGATFLALYQARDILSVSLQHLLLKRLDLILALVSCLWCANWRRLNLSVWLTKSLGLTSQDVYFQEKILCWQGSWQELSPYYFSHFTPWWSLKAPRILQLKERNQRSQEIISKTRFLAISLFSKLGLFTGSLLFGPSQILILMTFHSHDNQSCYLLHIPFHSDIFGITVETWKIFFLFLTKKSSWRSVFSVETSPHLENLFVFDTGRICGTARICRIWLHHLNSSAGWFATELLDIFRSQEKNVQLVVPLQPNLNHGKCCSYEIWKEMYKHPARAMMLYTFA